jgi:8-oxo-dGTP pyrophosphatase MutT (NUDIX family)
MNETITSTDIDVNTYQVNLNEVLPRHSAYAIIRRHDDILLSEQFNKLQLPGGGLNPGETSKGGVVREAKEETGVDVGNPQHVANAEKFVTWEENGSLKHVRLVAQFFTCEYISGEPSMEWLDGMKKKPVVCHNGYRSTHLSQLNVVVQSIGYR